MNVAAVTYEDINFAPIGVAGGAVGVAGVVATTVTNSTTEALVRQGATLNGGDNSAASADQSVSLLAASGRPAKQYQRRGRGWRRWCYL